MNANTKFVWGVWSKLSKTFIATVVFRDEFPTRKAAAIAAAKLNEKYPANSPHFTNYVPKRFKLK